MKQARRSCRPTSLVATVIPPGPPSAAIPRAIARKLAEEDIVRFSWENQNALWFGIVLTFSPSQLACFKVLWENFLNGNLPVPNQRVLCGLHGNTTHIYHLFKRHVAWKRVIVGDGRGNFWLRIPDSLREASVRASNNGPAAKSLTSARP